MLNFKLLQKIDVGSLDLLALKALLPAWAACTEQCAVLSQWPRYLRLTSYFGNRGSFTLNHVFFVCFYLLLFESKSLVSRYLFFLTQNLEFA